MISHFVSGASSSSRSPCRLCSVSSASSSWPGACADSKKHAATERPYDSCRIHDVRAASRRRGSAAVVGRRPWQATTQFPRRWITDDDKVQLKKLSGQGTPDLEKLEKLSPARAPAPTAKLSEEEDAEELAAFKSLGGNAPEGFEWGGTF